MLVLVLLCGPAVVVAQKFSAIEQPKQSRILSTSVPHHGSFSPTPKTPKPQILEVLFLHMLTPTPRHPHTPTPQHLSTSTPQHLNISVPQHLISNSTFSKRQAPTARSTLIIPCFSLLRACTDAKNTSDFKNLQLFQCRFSKFRFQD